MSATQSEFTHASDYRTITWQGKEYHLTRNQSLVVESLHDAYGSGHPEVGKDLLLQKVDSKNMRLRDTFKRSPLWGKGKLIVPGEKKGTYRLNLPGLLRSHV
jgi:hypothetical protein